MTTGTTRTSAQRRAQARIAYDAYLADCPARQLLDRISDKWVSLVLTALADGPQRYGGLARTLAGVSQKMLTQTLRTLERDGLISRAVTPSVPVRVDYALTPLGVSLLPVMRAIKDWAETHIEQVAAARESYDNRPAGPDVSTSDRSATLLRERS
ncbi:helix-turn-helix transcriptional regulator [Nonomuraea sp. NN258]|uniref:winged helix-turn-helix transcriptional regulator n=1 Tax=Nonomuraea antri TaxID=2730852 RepID=UPI00156A08AF|nr:helix-turn-helix domain-containing protein [Nonomuraea antri]NRQ31853.1 helix-turn-helix transcriptional regulator [Nonomuraea antri]